MTGSAISGSAVATVRVGQTTQASITLTPTSNIAKTFIVHFHFDSAFIEPCMRLVLQQVAEYAEAHSGEKLVIVGHTDKAGPSNYNQSLSERRSRSVFAYLTFGVDDAARTAALAEWNNLRENRPAGEQPSIKDSWDVREYQHILQDFGFYPGRVDGQDGPLTQDAVGAFRCKKGLPPGTTVDDDVWNALIQDYLGQNALAVPTSQFFPNCPGEILKWLGCGEDDPLDRRGTAFRPSRRVELMFVRVNRLPCEVPPPATFEKPHPGVVNSDWCIGSDTASKRCCFVSPVLKPGTNKPQPCPTDPDGPWCRQSAELGTIAVEGSIQRERPDGTLEPVPNQAFVLITPKGEFKAGEQSNGEPSPARTKGGSGSDRGTFSFTDMPIGFYSLEVRTPASAPVLVRLLEQTDRDIEGNTDRDIKGNAVCKALRSDTDRLDVVIVNAPVLREIRLPTVVHLMTALHPATREIRTCPVSGSSRREPQATAHTEADIRQFFEEANLIWRQARIRFNVADSNIVQEAYAFRTECEVDENEFLLLLERCAYPNVVNVFFLGDLAGTGEAGFGVSVENGAALGIAGCAVGDRFQTTILGPPLSVTLDPPRTIQVLAHELGHFLNLEHTDETPTNADRLMFPAGALDGSNRDLVQTEIDRARASQGADLECQPLTLQVTGNGVTVAQVGGSLSGQFVVLQNGSGTVTVDAEAPASGTVTMTDGTNTVSAHRLTVSTSTTGVTEVTATFTPPGGGAPFSHSVLIRVVTFQLRVEGATRVGGSGSTTFVTTTDPNDVVTVVAQISPTPFCVPSNLVTWTGGDAAPDPLRRRVSRARVAHVPVSATIAGVTRTVDITVIQLEIVARPTVTAPALTFVRVGLWDNAFDPATGDLRNDQAAANNFIDLDSRRFYFRLRDPGISGETTIRWMTVFGDDSPNDVRPSPPFSPDITLTETGNGTGVFLSRAVMIVTDATDRDQETNSGLPAGHPNAGNRGFGDSDHRLREITVDEDHQLDSKVLIEYDRRTPGTTPIRTTAFVFNRSPEERRRIRIHLVNVRESVGGDGVLTFLRQISVEADVRSIYARGGIFAEVDVIEIDPPASCIGWPGPHPDPGGVAADPGVEGFSLPGAFLTASTSQTDLINDVRGLPTFDINDIYIVFVNRIYRPITPVNPNLTAGSRGQSFPDAWVTPGSSLRSFTFVGLMSLNSPIDYTEPHEITHLTTNLRNSVGGHFELPAGDLRDERNLMHNGTIEGLGILDTKRLWDTRFNNPGIIPSAIPRQINTIRRSRFIRNF